MVAPTTFPVSGECLPVAAILAAKRDPEAFASAFEHIEGCARCRALNRRLEAGAPADRLRIEVPRPSPVRKRPLLMPTEPSTGDIWDSVSTNGSGAREFIAIIGALRGHRDIYVVAPIDDAVGNAA